MSLKQEIDRIVEGLKDYEPEKIILFGSLAREDFDEYSDLDIVIIKQTDKRFLERLREVVGFLPPHRGGIDIFVYTPEEFVRMKEEENPFIEQVLKDSKILYEKS